MSYAELMTQMEFVLRIVGACVCGIVIGYERKNRNKEAGIRTHAIVALGSALIMIVSKYGFEDIPDYDASRVAAQIVSGIGFLGAGIIFIKNNTVSGLTTAAGIWATSGIGMAIGAGLYYIGGITALLIVFIQFILHRRFIINSEHKYEMVELMINNNPETMGIIQGEFARNNIEVISMDMERMQGGGFKAELGIVLPKECSKSRLTELLLSCGDVNGVKC
ncbi:MgtC/SapB family protein [Clostridium sp. MCC353]|uniref:MgtC/SapB family protein n=1 Tax=Clostridium sp. MCC353 TaxID=2592646 RepID=UPI001C0121B1|nr:MgtC/SapB family protein [Clostridium sp. MCC353]MBT9775060.1 MgtC/SapB family protein [Clostridium sp. MCC353]